MCVQVLESRHVLFYKNFTGLVSQGPLSDILMMGGGGGPAESESYSAINIPQNIQISEVAVYPNKSLFFFSIPQKIPTPAEHVNCIYVTVDLS